MAAGFALAGLVAAGRATPPLDPLPAPRFSFDRASPKVQNGTVDARGILMLDPVDVRTDIPGMAFGLESGDDELDALSAANATVLPDVMFALLFSVDAASTGVAAPAPELVALNVPYNVVDQVDRGHASGDQFMSTSLFTLDAITGIKAIIDWNNVLVRNNFDEGGTDFAALPETSAYDVVIDEPQDHVDAVAVFVAPDETIYWSASRDSPSLPGLPGQGDPSGASIFVFTRGGANPPDATPPQQTAEDAGCRRLCQLSSQSAYEQCIAEESVVTQCEETARSTLEACLAAKCVFQATPAWLYASFADLHLQQEDDIDALIVFDTNADGAFNETDSVLFSLTPDSPSLATIPGASVSGGAADVFMVSAAVSEPALFASAAALGLGAVTDNIDALDLVLCEDAEACAVAHGIRAQDPIPTLSEWGLVVLALLMIIAGTLALPRARAGGPVRSI